LEQYGQNYATNFLLPYEQQLATLAGANFVPNSATGISGYVSGANIASQGLASLGYAAGGGANNSSTLALISALAAKG
jgi:hypothetical protein